MNRRLSQFPGLKEFCQKLYDQSHRSPHLLACMVDTYEEMLEMGCSDAEGVLQKALQVRDTLSSSLASVLGTDCVLWMECLAWIVHSSG